MPIKIPMLRNSALSKLIFILICLFLLISKSALAAPCATSGNISSDCENMQWNGSNSQLSTGTTINNTTDLGYLHSDSVSVYLNSTSSGVFTNNGSILNETNNISGNPAVFVNLTGGYKNAINNLGTISAAPSSGYNTAFGIFVGDTFGGVTTA